MDNGRKPRILIFSTAYYPFVGGAEISVKEITDRLEQYFDFDLITARFERNLPKFERIGNVNVYRTGFGNKTFDKLTLPFLGSFLALRLGRRNKYFCFWGVMVTFASLSAYFCNILKSLTGQREVPVVLTLQEGDSEEHLKYRWAGLINLSWKFALNNTRILTGISNFLLDRAKRTGFLGESVLVPNGVDLHIFQKEVEDNIKNKIKNELGKNEGNIFLVTTSRLSHKNAVDDVISALSILPENIKFIIIGNGLLRDKLEKQVRDLALEERVKFLGFIDYESLPDYFSACDIFIRPSRSEGFGNSFIEAMAYGIPVIATPVGGIVDFISDNETGVFCSPDNPQSIVNAVKILLEDKELKDKIVENAKKLVIEKYGWDKISIDMKKEVFDKLLK